MSWWHNPSSHAPTLLSGGLVDIDLSSNMWRTWEEAAFDRDGRPGSFPCGGGGAAGEHAFGGTLISMDTSVLEYHAASGAWRALSCPPLSMRAGYPNPECRKLGAGTDWPPHREVTYLGQGRVMAWERATLRFDTYSFSARGRNVLRNASAAPFFAHAGSGRLAGIDNASTLMHLKLPTATAPAAARTPASSRPAVPPVSEPNFTAATGMTEPEPPPPLHTPPADGVPRASTGVDIVLELLNDGSSSYRVWNSEGWAHHAVRGLGDTRRSPLAGPVGRGRLPAGSEPRPQRYSGEDDSDLRHIVWTPSPTEAYLVEVDLLEGSYRTLGVKVLDLDSLQPATSRQPPLHFEVLSDGALDADAMECEGASTRRECAARGGACGWCEQRDGVQPSMCTAGGPARPCAATCAAWRFFDPRHPVMTSDAPPPAPPSPPGLSESALLRLEAHTHALPTSARVAPQPRLGGANVEEGAMQAEAVGAQERAELWVDPSGEQRSKLVHKLRSTLHSLEQLALRPFDPPDNAVPPQPIAVWRLP